MKQFSQAMVAVLVAFCVVYPQTVVRQQFGSMTTAKLATVPDFVLPAVYKDRVAHPLPAAVDNSTLKYLVTGWTIHGWSCANATGTSCYEYEVNCMRDSVTSGIKPYFTYDYPYNFLNSGNWSTGGDGWMFVEAFDIFKKTGCPTTVDFGGNALGANCPWMSGYDKYYRAMKLRAEQYCKIDVTTPAGDTLVKQYLYDHGDAGASKHGGILTFQMNSGDRSYTTVSGRKTMPKMGGGGGHGEIILGYDDTFNGGSYEVYDNDSLIGIVWIKYSQFKSGAGGWYPDNGLPTNKYFMFCRIKKDYTPKFAFKINLTESQRNQICIMTGVANSTTATAPTKTKDYQGAFNYAGGAIPMCGKGQSSTIEIGLDLTDLDSVVAGGQGTFFLKIISKGGLGTVNSLALEDYNGASVREIPCSQTNVAITGTVLMAVPWTGTVTNEIDREKMAALHRGNGLQATFDPDLQAARFSFPAHDIRSAVLQIRDLSGRIILSRACKPHVSGAVDSETWDLKNDSGRKVGRGAYIASVNITAPDGMVTRLVSRIMVRG